MYFIDTHTHLYREYYPDTFEATVQRAIDARVPYMILGCVNAETPTQINEAVDLFPKNMFALVGLHPEDVKENYEDELTALEKHFSDPNVIGVGEIGLDYYWDRTYEQQQKEVFYKQLCWARDRHLPLSLHIRNAYPDAIEILKQFKEGELTGVMHCFSGGIQEALWAVKHGFAIGVGGIVTFKNSKLQELLPQIGLEHIVLETDAPYLAPVPYRGKTNESAYIPFVAQKLAEIFGVSVEVVAEQTTKTARQIFKLPEYNIPN
ncbi:MAG: TatD family hydrolase [Bacteroidales bacterium]|nr:TatD family hydrolase [Bacteroidales bacterium]